MDSDVYSLHRGDLVCSHGSTPRLKSPESVPPVAWLVTGAFGDSVLCRTEQSLTDANFTIVITDSAFDALRHTELET
jgi:hypothetical protein